MRVVAAIPLYPPHSRVGAWLATHRFLAHLVGCGHVVDVVTTAADATYRHEGVDVHPSRTPRDIVGDADVVLTHNGACETWTLEAIHRGIPNVRMVHSFSDAGLDHLRRTPIDLAVFSSAAVMRAYDADVPSIVCHPVTIGSEHRTTPGDRVTLVNLSAEKGVELFRLLALSMPDRRFLAVRGGYGRQERISAPNCETVPTTPDMASIWTQTRILAMPSASESWGMVGVEAMASGIPVIAHPSDGLVESLGDAGTFVDRCDLAGWRREVERLHDPDEWAAASERAIARFESIDHEDSLRRFAHALEQLGGAP